MSELHCVSAWEEYRDLIPEDERGNFVAAYSKRLKSTDPAVEVFLKPLNGRTSLLGSCTSLHLNGTTI